MSLIKNALNKAQKDSELEKTPSGVPLKDSNNEKKLFLKLFLSGTAFFTILILLFVFYKDDEQPFSQDATPTQEIPLQKGFSAPLASDITINNTPPTPEPEFPTPLANDREDPTWESENILPQETEQQIADDESNQFEWAEIDDSFLYREAVEEKPNEKDTLTSLNEDLATGIAKLAARFIKPPKEGEEDIIQFKKETEEKPEKHSKPREKKHSLTASTAPQALQKLLEETKAKKSIHPKFLSPEQKISQYLDNLSITGVMISDTQRKVLIDNRVYLVNTTISSNPHLTIAEIRPHQIIFENEQGQRFSKDF